ncbi:hypothetical protein IP78_04355 [Brevundimonas sp. AAP58]|uniref:hypothetical protein n=1 Tax=Brevundimonas sp. AAP58 TaxID=1523422 RepID=UPI0006B8E3FA|nr:hypothetical protein [Brevundimonas sp. AAP58]KPF82164.1 hypothetical protein IP78_04355 [Brevundimonas sp. AAP58]
MLDMIALALTLQSADLEAVRLCVGGQFTGFRRADGRVWWSDPTDDSDARKPFDPSRYPTVHDRAWFAARAPLTVDGRTYVYDGMHRIEWAFNRYYRQRPDHDGVIAAAPQGSEESILLLLSNPIGCEFAQYRLSAEID